MFSDGCYNTCNRKGSSAFGPTNASLKSVVRAAAFDLDRLGTMFAEDKGEQGLAQHYVFNWLDWTPAPGSRCYNALHSYFPGALPGPAVHHRIRCILENEHGFTVEKTLFGTSTCPDEINNKVGDLSDIMKSYWGNIFPLGGISGAPFVGATGFTAFSHHVPDDGDIIIVFGPHVGISREGEIGKIMREGQHKNSTSCGAVVGAFHAAAKAEQGQEQDGEEEFNELDMQMTWIKAQLEPHARRISSNSNPMSALAYQAYEMVKAKLEMIVNTDFGKGRLVLVGGVQINMPEPFKDHFLPLTFDVHQKSQLRKDLLSSFACVPPEISLSAVPAKKDIVLDAKKAIAPDAKKAAAPDGKKSGSKQARPNDSSNVDAADFDHSEDKVKDWAHRNQHMVFAWLTWSPQPGTRCYKTLHEEFPGALPGSAVHHRVSQHLAKEYGLTPENTLFGNSICSDEINNTPDGLSALLAGYFGTVFPMGGLGGVPFAGKTGFKAFSAHVPENGNIVILYGPHVAVSETGEVGKYLRKGQQKYSTACGAVIGAYHAGCNQKENEDVEFDETDMQMGWIKSQLVNHCERIKLQENQMAALAYQAFEVVKAKINRVVDTEFGNGCLVLIGGIQINLPPPCNDHFLPMTFEVRQAGKTTKDIKEVFQIPMNEEELMYESSI